MVSAVSPTRRVLGDKPTNTTIRKQSPIKTTKSHGFREAAQGTTVEKTELVKAGVKRSIEEVDDAERVDSQDNNSQRSTGTQVLSLMSDSDEESAPFGVGNSDTTDLAASMSIRHSRQEESPIETTFEIMEEDVSQNTRDSLNAVPLPQNASQPTGLRPFLAQNLSQASVGMSSFINFDPSQQDDLQPLPTPKEEGLKEDARPEVHDERTRAKQAAEQLRTRLRLAYYKVTTNQTNVPFSRLKAPSRPRSPEADHIMSSSPPSSPAAHRPSPETRIAIMRARAAMQAKKPLQPLEKLYMPVIVPTAFSARNMDQTGTTNVQPQMPSSPPQSRHVSIDGADDTPRPIARNADVHHEKQPPKTPMQLSSPPGSPEKLLHTVTKTGVRHWDGSTKSRPLTSSVVKGDAAQSLLRMKNHG